MFRKGKKKSSKGLNRFIKKIKKNDTTSSEGQGENGPQNANTNADSDYEDSHALDDSSTNAIEVYVDNEEDSTYQNQPRSALTQSDDGSHSGASTEKPKVPVRVISPETIPKPAVAAAAAEVETVVETVTPSKPPAALTEEERKARARKAIEERKKKSRADIAARRARAAGIAIPPVAVAVAASVVTPEKEKDIEVPIAVEPDEDSRRRALSEERLRLVEQERREEEEAIEAKRKEEAELKKLEEDLLREEEEAKAEAGKMAEKLETIQKEEALENALKKEVKVTKKVTKDWAELTEKIVVDKVEVEAVVETIDSSELEEEEEAGRLRAEELAKLEAEGVVTEELAKRKAEQAIRAEELAAIEAERVRAEELAKLEAELAEVEAERVRADELAKLEAELAEVEAERLRSDELVKFEAEMEENTKAERLRAEELAKFEAEMEENTKAERLRAEELAKFEAEMEENTKAERLRAEELAKFEAEMEEKTKTVNVEMNESQHEKARKKAEDDALRALDQFITHSSDDVDDVYRDDSVNDIDLDDLLDGSLSVNDSMTLDTTVDGPIAFTAPTSKSVHKKMVAPKPKIPSKPAPRSSSKANVQKPTANSLNSRPTPVGNKPNKKPSVSSPRKPAPSLASNTPNKKPSVWKSQYLSPTLAISKSNQKSSVSKLRKPTPTLACDKPNEKASTSKPCDISHLRPPRKTPTPKGKRRITEAASIDSMGSVCTVTSIPPSPFQFPLMQNMPICNLQYIPKLHAKPGGCAVCIYKLSETEREKYEKNGRHYLVAQTTGGCLGCNIFPSQPDEEPVRLCKKCFFDTHLLHVKPDEAFAGSGFLTGVQKNRFKYSINLRRYASSRK